MSTEEHDTMATSALPEHVWLDKFVGEWRIKTVMMMGADDVDSMPEGREVVTKLGDLWVVGEGSSPTPDGSAMEYKISFGYDVSFKHYTMVWIGNISSHAWLSKGSVSNDGKTMTLISIGPDMVKDGETAEYREVITMEDENNRFQASYGKDENGEWVQFMKAHYTRVR